MPSNAVAARVCSCGCARPLLTKNGLPDFSHRRFFSKECLNRDRALRVSVRRSRTRKRVPAKTVRIAGTEFSYTNPRELVRELRRRGVEIEMVRA